MNSIDSIIRRLQETHNVEESTFNYNDSEYENWFGRYYRNKQPISREEYEKAMHALLAQEDEEGSIAQKLNEPSKELVQKIKDFRDFIDGIEYDTDTETNRATREGHLSQIDPQDETRRVQQIVSDTDLSEEEAKQVNKIISRYTSTDNYTVFNVRERALLDKFIDQSPIYEGTPVYRGLGFKQRLGEEGLPGFEQYLDLGVGDKMTFKGYASFSSDPDIAVEFAVLHGDHLVFIVNTRNLSGISIDHLSSIGYEEQELLYKATTQMEIKEKVVDGDTIYFHVEEIGMIEDTEDEAIKLPISGSMYIEDK